MLDTTNMPEQVANVFDGLAHREALLEARALILSEAERLATGPVEETLKWGQPSYLVKNGSTVRLGLQGGAPALFVHCQTNIIEAAREHFCGVASFSGNRAVLLDSDKRAITHVICTALTYHQR